MTDASYGEGGWLQTGWTAATNTSGEPELVLTPEQWRSLEEEE